MQENIPANHVADAYELTSLGVRDLFKIELRNTEGTVLYLTSENAIEYQGNTWETLSCKLSENSQNSTGEQSRPKFACANPDGVFSLFVQEGALDGAVFTRYRVLLPDLEANNANYIRNLWIISKVVSLNKQLITLELRSSMDGINFNLPARSFYPPDFPHVSLS